MSEQSNQPPKYHIRQFAGVDDHLQAETLQMSVWRGDSPIPNNVSIAMQRHGGLTIGAFLDSGDLIGYVFGWLSPSSAPGASNGLMHYSHLAAVRSELQGYGIGEALKRAQAVSARALGLNLMAWTYDPLEARNAHLNIHKLGCIVRTYIPNAYGDMRDSLNAGLPSDRFETEWWLNEEDRDVWRSDRATAHMRIKLERDFQSLKKRDAEAALAYRLHTRQLLTEAFADDYVVTDVYRDGVEIGYELGRFPGARLAGAHA